MSSAESVEDWERRVTRETVRRWRNADAWRCPWDGCAHRDDEDYHSLALAVDHERRALGGSDAT